MDWHQWIDTNFDVTQNFTNYLYHMNKITYIMIF